MFPTNNHRNRNLAPLLADLFHELLDRGTRINKVPAESHIVVECVGDSKDAGPSRASATTSVQSAQLETEPKEEPAEVPASAPASVPSHSPFKGQRKKSILTTESKTNPLYKEKLRQRLRLLFSPDVDTLSKPSKQATEPSLGRKLTPSKDSARLETPLDDLMKRMLTLETNMDSMC